MKLLTDESLRINPFSRDITYPDMEDANEETNIIWSDEEIDEVYSLLLLQLFYVKKTLKNFFSAKNFINASLQQTPLLKS